MASCVPLSWVRWKPWMPISACWRVSPGTASSGWFSSCLQTQMLARFAFQCEIASSPTCFTLNKPEPREMPALALSPSSSGWFMLISTKLTPSSHRSNPFSGSLLPRNQAQTLSHGLQDLLAMPWLNSPLLAASGTFLCSSSQTASTASTPLAWLMLPSLPRRASPPLHPFIHLIDINWIPISLPALQ